MSGEFYRARGARRYDRRMDYHTLLPFGASELATSSFLQISSAEISTTAPRALYPRSRGPRHPGCPAQAKDMQSRTGSRASCVYAYYIFSRRDIKVSLERLLGGRLSGIGESSGDKRIFAVYSNRNKITCLVVLHFVIHICICTLKN